MALSLCLTTVDQVEARLVKKLGRPLTEHELWELCLAVELDWDNYFNGVGGVPLLLETDDSQKRYAAVLAASPYAHRSARSPG